MTISPKLLCETVGQAYLNMILPWWENKWLAVINICLSSVTSRPGEMKMQC